MSLLYADVAADVVIIRFNYYSLLHWEQHTKTLALRFSVVCLGPLTPFDPVEINPRLNHLRSIPNPE